MIAVRRRQATRPTEDGLTALALAAAGSLQAPISAVRTALPALRRSTASDASTRQIVRRIEAALREAENEVATLERLTATTLHPN